MLEGSSFLNTGQTSARSESVGKRLNTMEVLNNLAFQSDDNAAQDSTMKAMEACLQDIRS